MIIVSNSPWPKVMVQTARRKEKTKYDKNGKIQKGCANKKMFSPKDGRIRPFLDCLVSFGECAQTPN